VLLVAVAVLLVALVPFGWRFASGISACRRDGRWAQDIAVAAAFVAALSLVLRGDAEPARGRRRRGDRAPRISGSTCLAAQDEPRPAAADNDITTDAENPPAFAATLTAREAEHGVSAAYGGAATASQRVRPTPNRAGRPGVTAG